MLWMRQEIAHHIRYDRAFAVEMAEYAGQIEHRTME